MPTVRTAALTLALVCAACSGDDGSKCARGEWIDVRKSCPERESRHYFIPVPASTDPQASWAHDPSWALRRVDSTSLSCGARRPGTYRLTFDWIGAVATAEIAESENGATVRLAGTPSTRVDSSKARTLPAGRWRELSKLLSKAKPSSRRPTERMGPGPPKLYLETALLHGSPRTPDRLSRP